MILGVGVDIVQVPRIEKLYATFGQKFLSRNYHPLEIAEFTKKQRMTDVTLTSSLAPINQKIIHRRQMLFLAKRFAAKEAIAKAIGTGIGQVGFKQIAVTNDSHGAPVAKIFSDDLNNYAIYLSLADDYPIAIAYAMVSTTKQN